MKNKSRVILIIGILISLILAFHLVKFTRTSIPIKIGFVADFSLDSNNVGVSGRNGIMTAIDEINTKGGIKGRHLELITADNKNNVDSCDTAVKSLIDSGVSVIIGPLLSQMINSVVDTTKNSDLLVISPVVKSNQLTGIDDHLIKVNSTAKEEGYLLADAIFKRKDKKVALLWSAYNRLYTYGVISGLKEKLIENNINIELEYQIEDDHDQTSIVEKLKELNLDAIVFVAKGDIVAGITQKFSILGDIPNLYASEWTKITQVSEFGGKSINGMVFSDSAGRYTESLSSLAFYNHYTEHFFIEPSTPSYLSYESMMIFYYAALQNGGNIDRDSLKKTILSSEYDILSDVFHFDRYGDVIRNDKILYIIKDSEYYIY
ncbi:MAG: ABC transporter substrate-binding protein [Spirochaetaceae bacterium]